MSLEISTLYWAENCSAAHRIVGVQHSILQMQNMISTTRNQFQIMRNNQNGFSVFFEHPKNVGHLPHVTIVESAGWLIKQNNFFFGGDSACNRNPLFLSAGKRHRVHISERFHVQKP